VVIITLLMAVTTYVDIERQRAQERNDLEERGVLLANSLNSVLPRPLRERDSERLGDFSSAIWAQQDVAYVKIFDEAGNLLVGPGRNQFGPRGVQDASVLRSVEDLHTVHRWNADGLEVTTPVTAGASLLGVVQFGLTTDRIDDEIRALTVNRLWQTAALLVAGVSVAYLVASYLTEPIMRLVGATRRLAAGNLDTRVQISRGREMRELGRAFNDMAAELEEQVQALQESRTRIVKAQEDVRRDIAVHLHGPVQGRLLALKAQLEDLNRSNDLAPDVSGSLTTIVANMGQVIQEEISLLSRRLYPAIVRRGVVPSMQSLHDQFEVMVDVQLEIDESLGAQERLNPNLIPEQTRLATYRIAEEAFTNVMKHADARVVTLALDLEEGYLNLRIHDDGAGFAAVDTQAGLGLAVMLDYAQAVGGTCKIESAPGEGTSVIAVLPASTPSSGGTNGSAPPANSGSPRGTESLP
jgi:signal transduction histidine kinase